MNEPITGIDPCAECGGNRWRYQWSRDVIGAHAPHCSHARRARFTREAPDTPNVPAADVPPPSVELAPRLPFGVPEDIAAELTRERMRESPELAAELGPVTAGEARDYIAAGIDAAEHHANWEV